MNSVEPADLVFEAERARLVALAYRMLGSIAEAEDVVQEVWLRWHRARSEVVERPGAWLTTVTSRLSLDALRSARMRRERYVGPWLPEPIVWTMADADGPEAHSELAESLRLGFLVLLDSLGPVERVVFLLKDVFGVPFSEIAQVVEKTPDACRQIAVRARAHLARGRASLERPSPETWQVVGALAAAVMSGDVDRVLQLVRDDVVLVSDGGPDHRAARRPVLGAARVTRLLLNLMKRLPSDAVFEPRSVNGDPGVVLRLDGQPFMVVSFEEAGGLVQTIRVMLNPKKLNGIAPLTES